jgi:uncharacterized protein
MSQVLDTFGCIANTIKVSAGHYVDLANPDPATIEIDSIASALAKICRFGGHSPKFYSVAEHCIHATNLAVASGVTGEALLAVFLHDAAEAYIGDVVKPLKWIMIDYMVTEQRIEGAIEEAFSVDFELHKDVIKRFDRAMLRAEKLGMWPGDSEMWSGFADAEAFDVPLAFWSPEEAENHFLAMARTFQLKR